MTCSMDEYLGAYLLCALNGDEEVAVTAHLSACPRCAEEVAGLAETVSRMALLSRHDVEQALAVRPGGDRPPTAVGPRYGPAKHRVRGAGLAVLATVALGGAAAGAAAWFSDERPPAATITVSDRVSDVGATLTVTRRDAATALHLSLRGAYPGETCSLVVHDRDGRAQTVATWPAGAGGTADVRATTPLPPDELDHVDVVTNSGHRLVRLPVAVSGR